MSDGPRGDDVRHDTSAAGTVPAGACAPDTSAADTAGRTWTGREVTSTGFDGDVGSADIDLLAAFEDPRDETMLMRAVRAARWLVPVVAAPTSPVPPVPPVPAVPGADDVGEPAVERRASSSATEMAVITLTSPDGQRGFPVFSSVAALLAWDATARPSPATSSRAAQGAVAERCDVMLLDLGSGHECVLRPSMVWALAQQRDWLPAHTDPFVAQALTRATADEKDVIDCVSEEGDPSGAGILRVVLRLRSGLDSAQVQALATRVGERIATDGEARARIDGLTFTIRQA